MNDSINCNCPDWETAGETFHEAINMIWIKYCPWCGMNLYEEMDEPEEEITEGEVEDENP